jgi:hypothetical protein
LRAGYRQGAVAYRGRGAGLIQAADPKPGSALPLLALRLRADVGPLACPDLDGISSNHFRRDSRCEESLSTQASSPPGNARPCVAASILGPVRAPRAGVGERLEYMHLNPVRRGLVRKPEQWRWSSYNNFSLDQATVRACAIQADYVSVSEQYRA